MYNRGDEFKFSFAQDGEQREARHCYERSIDKFTENAYLMPTTVSVALRFAVLALFMIGTHTRESG
jgi:hypothetical protein